MKCIALTGGKQNGKDTAGNIIRTLMSNVIERRCMMTHGFAYELKLELVNMFNTDVYDYEKACAILDELKEKYPHIRQLMQAHGDYQKAKHGADYWIKKFFNFIEEVEEIIPNELPSLLVVPDLRFLNELDALKINFAPDDLLILRIMRTPMPVNFIPDNHISETELNSIRPDEVVENPWGSVPQFHSNLKAALVRKGWLASMES